MGFRNPFRMSVDKATGVVYLGDYGPDAGAPTRTAGPAGTVAFERIARPGNYGWPYCSNYNDALPRVRLPQRPVRRPVQLRGADEQLAAQHRQQHPAAVAGAWTSGTATAARGRARWRGGRSRRWAARSTTTTPRTRPTIKFPASYDDHWFPCEFGRRWIKETALDAATGGPLEVSPFLDDPAIDWSQPMDMEFGPDGALYVLDYGTGWFGGDANSALYRIEYVQGGRRPIAVVAADKTSTSGTPLTVQFSSAGSHDPDGDAITYAWDFGNGRPRHPSPTRATPTPPTAPTRRR